jgi:hypothetical protein
MHRRPFSHQLLLFAETPRKTIMGMTAEHALLE